MVRFLYPFLALVPLFSIWGADKWLVKFKKKISDIYIFRFIFEFANTTTNSLSFGIYIFCLFVNSIITVIPHLIFVCHAVLLTMGQWCLCRLQDGKLEWSLVWPLTFLPPTSSPAEDCLCGTTHTRTHIAVSNVWHRGIMLYLSFLTNIKYCWKRWHIFTFEIH